MRAVDIIIPVYNGYDDIQLCMDSILRHTDLTRHRVILVNDKSPDERILPLLRGYAEAHEHVELIDSPVNEGFSASVNKGMSFSDRDVILLNSDTIVTRGWVDKITACAYSAPEIGTVTPLSNSATLCSVPVTCQDNPVPEHFTIDEYAELIERVSLKRYPRITVAVGFCMFIKREVIQRVGLFDAETFGRGYGEENDFCNRAEQYGYIQVMCDDTFIYHKGTGSFDSEEKRRLCAEHERILEERYPEQMQQNHLYCVNNPEQYIRDNINLYANLHNGRPNLLYLLHEDIREDLHRHPGGTEFHVRDLIKGLRGRYNIFVLYPVGEDLCLQIFWDEQDTLLKFPMGPAPVFQMYTDRRLTKLFRQILSAFQINLVHVHHVLHLSLDLFYCAHEMNIPMVATLHDYFFVCPTVKLLNDQGKYCGGAASGEECARCLKRQLGIATQVDYIQRWREESEKALSLCQTLVVPSRSTAELYSKTFPSLKDKFVVIPHGSDYLDAPRLTEAAVERVEHSREIGLHVDNLYDSDSEPDLISGWAFIQHVDAAQIDVVVEITESNGNVRRILANKYPREDIQKLFGGGTERYLDSGFFVTVPRYQLCAGQAKVRILLQYNGCTYTDGTSYTVDIPSIGGEKKQFRVAFLGGMTPAKGSERAYELITRGSREIQWYIFGSMGDEKLIDLQQDTLLKLGTYTRDTICELLKECQIDLICILSTSAETFCYTLSEAWLAGVPVLATDIGAVGERIRESGAGITVPLSAGAEEVLAQIEQLRMQPERYQNLKQALHPVPVRTVREMLEDYIKLYDGMGGAQCRYASFSPAMMLQATRERERPSCTEYELNELRRELDQKKNELAAIRRSRSYRLAGWLSRLLHFWRRG